MNFALVDLVVDATASDLRMEANGKEYLVRFGGFDDEVVTIEARDIEEYPATAGVVHVLESTLESLDVEPLLLSVKGKLAESIEADGEPRLL